MTRSSSWSTEAMHTVHHSGATAVPAALLTLLGASSITTNLTSALFSNASANSAGREAIANVPTSVANSLKVAPTSVINSSNTQKVAAVTSKQSAMIFPSSNISNTSAGLATSASDLYSVQHDQMIANHPNIDAIAINNNGMMMQHAAPTMPHFAFHHPHGLGTNTGGQPPSAMNHAANRVSSTTLFGGGLLPAAFPFGQVRGEGARCPPQRPLRQISPVVGGCGRSGTSSSASVLDSPSLPSPQLEHLDRATRKPMMEKKRRTRMNASLKTMEDILIDNAVQQNSKMEKADILEKTIQFIYEMMRQRDDFIQRLQNVGNAMEQAARLAHDSGVNEALRNATSAILDCVNSANLGPHGEALTQKIVARLAEVRHNCDGNAAAVIHQLLENADTARPSTSAAAAATAPPTTTPREQANSTAMLRTPTQLRQAKKLQATIPQIPTSLAGPVIPQFPPYVGQMGSSQSFLQPLAGLPLPTIIPTQFESVLTFLQQQQQQQIKRQQQQLQQQQFEQQQVRSPLQSIAGVNQQQTPLQPLSRPPSFSASWIMGEKDSTTGEDKENELVVDVLQDESDDEEEEYEDDEKGQSEESVDAATTKTTTADTSARSADSGIASHDTTAVSSTSTPPEPAARRRKRKHSVNGEMWRPYH